MEVLTAVGGGEGLKRAAAAGRVCPLCLGLLAAGWDRRPLGGGGAGLTGGELLKGTIRTGTRHRVLWGLTRS